MSSTPAKVELRSSTGALPRSIDRPPPSPARDCSRAVIEGALEDLLPAVEKAVLEYVADLIEEEASTLTSAAKLHELIGEWVEGSSYASDEIVPLCARLYEELLAWNVVPSAEDSALEHGEESAENDDDEYLVEEGLCVICERRMPLTKHHTIPKCMHRKYAKQYSEERLNSTIDLCRPCHSAVHRMEDNATLAESYHELNTILEHPRMQKWVPYIQKQRVVSERHRKYQK